MASKELIRQVAESNDVVDVIGHYVKLTRAGSEFRALSPFTNEKTPSFYVMPAKQAFYCFSSQQGGDVFKFLQLYENLSFPEALKKLADRAGIRLEEQEITPEMKARERLRRQVRQLQAAARDWFHLLLLRSPNADPARQYLKQRGFNIDIAKSWKLGYAPENSRAFLDWARQAGFSQQVLLDGGLARHSDRGGGVYAHFRNRLMFPIANDYGETVAFSGRVLSPDQKGGKYVNSPETAIFDKGKTFFGFDKSKQPVLKAGYAILCEGQLDMIAAYEQGVTNIVAPLGTAFTEGHARLLRRHTEEVVICFDADGAGQRAAEKTFEKLSLAGVFVRVARMPDGEDPDSFIQKQGVEAFQAVIDDAEEFFDFQINLKIGGQVGASIKDRAQLAQSLAEKASLIEDPLKQGLILEKLSSRLGVSSQELGAIAARSAKTRRRQARTRDYGETANSGDEASPPIPLPQSPLLKTLCRLLLTSKAGREWLLQHGDIELLKDVPETDLVQTLWNASVEPENPGSMSGFLAELPAAMQNTVSLLLVGSGLEGGEDLARDCYLALQRQSLQNRSTAQKAHLNRLSPDDPEVDTALMELAGLERELRKLPKSRTLPSE